MAVMRHDDERPLVFQQILLQHIQRHDIQIVRRLVQDEQVGVFHQDGQQVEPPFFAAGKLPDPRIQHIVRKQELSQQAGIVHRLQYGLILIEPHPFLAVVADLEGFSAVDDTGQLARVVRIHPTGEQVEEGGLARPVPTDDAHLFVALEIVGEPVQITLPSVVKTDLAAIDDFRAQTRAGAHFRQAHLRGAIHLFRALLQLQEGVLAVFRLAGAGAGRSMDPFQLAPEDIVDFRGLGVVIIDALLPLFQVVLVIPTIGVDGSVVHFHHDVAHAVQEIPVVRNHQQGAARTAQIPLQELDGVDVQVVGGLVHDQEIGLAGQQLRQRHPFHLAARKLLHPFAEIAQVETRQ